MCHSPAAAILIWKCYKRDLRVIASRFVGGLLLENPADPLPSSITMRFEFMAQNSGRVLVPSLVPNPTPSEWVLSVVYHGSSCTSIEH